MDGVLLRDLLVLRKVLSVTGCTRLISLTRHDQGDSTQIPIDSIQLSVLQRELVGSALVSGLGPSKGHLAAARRDNVGSRRRIGI